MSSDPLSTFLEKKTALVSLNNVRGHLGLVATVGIVVSTSAAVTVSIDVVGTEIVSPGVGLVRMLDHLRPVL